ncbi:hypothetical protein [Shewanella colwelliana]|uniref:hypothetical protein n=1 Tax=Shewanella colwelliana TaxID=23 RepID=UPI0022AE535D|nr:hypothetical protein [Shewanella colwelliana]MCZ4339910.1 hypothetical protein [Shewanella colwelliana]
MSTEKLGNFGGHLVDLLSKDNELSLRLLSWNAFEEGYTPVLSIIINGYNLSSSNQVELDEVKSQEYEVDGVEIEENEVQIWVYGFDKPLTIQCSDVTYEFQGLSESDLRRLLKISQTSNNEQYKDIVALRNKIDSIEKFVSEQESRINIKCANHPEGSEGHKLYKEQLKLLNRLRSRLNT